MNLKKAISFGIAMMLMVTLNANATAVYFTDRAAFDAATGGGLSFESFETFFSTQSTVVFDGFSIKELNGDNQIHHVTTSSQYISAVSDGDGATIYQDNGDSIGMFFDFSSPINAIGMDITVNPLNTIHIGGSVDYTMSFSANNTPTFWGVIDLDGIDTLTFDGVETGSTNYIGFDAVSYGQVPEPATMLLLGLGGLVLRKRKNKRD